MPAATDFRELYLSVISALPMQHEAYGLSFRRGHDLFQGSPKETFLVFWRTAGIVPEPGEVPRQGQNLPLLCIGEWALAVLPQGREIRFELHLRGQRLVPATFEFRRDEPVRRIHRIILTPGADHFIA